MKQMTHIDYLQLNNSSHRTWQCCNKYIELYLLYLLYWYYWLYWI